MTKCLKLASLKLKDKSKEIIRITIKGPKIFNDKRKPQK